MSQTTELINASQKLCREAERQRTFSKELIIESKAAIASAKRVLECSIKPNAKEKVI